jgi:VIT1/CCC1 family predicted Fe2+/Mn2+ transporter
MKKSYKAGISFGLVSGVLTTLGLLIGLGVSTKSKAAVIGGILTIAIADALSDSFGVHLSQESSGDNTTRQVWEATFATFFSKFFFALTFLVPVSFLSIKVALIVSVIWGLLLISVLSLLITDDGEGGKGGKIPVLAEHLSLFLLVVVLSYLVGFLIEKYI